MTAAPTLGGLITESLGWRWIFYLNLPVGLLLMLLVRHAIQESRDPQSARLDPWGSLAFSASLLCLIWGLIEANRIGWDNPLTYARLSAGVLLLGLFVWVESVQRRPMIDLQLFRHPRFIGALLGMFAYAGCAQVMMTLLPFYLQNGLGFSAIASGLGMLPFALAMLICPRIGARLASRFSPASLMAAGLTLVGCGNLFSAWAVDHGGYLSFALTTAVTGAGAGLLNGDTQKNIMACVPRDGVGMASGMSTTMRFSAIVLAIGVFGALLGSHTGQNLEASLKQEQQDSGLSRATSLPHGWWPEICRGLSANCPRQPGCESSRWRPGLCCRIRDGVVGGRGPGPAWRTAGGDADAQTDSADGNRAAGPAGMTLSVGASFFKIKRSRASSLLQG